MQTNNNIPKLTQNATTEENKVRNAGYDCGYFSKPYEEMSETLAAGLLEIFLDAYDQGQRDRMAEY